MMHVPALVNETVPAVSIVQIANAAASIVNVTGKPELATAVGEYDVPLTTAVAGAAEVKLIV